MVKGKMKGRRWAPVLCGVLAVLVLVCAGYVNDYYKADLAGIEAFDAGTAVQVQQLDNGDYVCMPEGADTGLIFYPGGKVDHGAYVPLMQALAARGIGSVLVEMPLHLAVLDVDAAAGIPEQYPQIGRWYIGGHSLGGSMAAAYLAEEPENFAGLVLLGSYSTADLSGTELDVLSVYGSEDGVMNREKYAQNKGNLPQDFAEHILEGGCHAYFGMYGAQEGDGAPTITNEAQILFTADIIAAMMDQSRN